MSLPAGLAETAAGALATSFRLPFTANPDDLPNAPGAYLLAIRLADAVPLDLPRFGNPVLSPGWYLYCGSARGPGGMCARVRRHMKHDKALRWHVDRLTVRAAEIVACALPGGSECGLVAALRKTGGFTAPLPGFGSSDCRTCDSHLLVWRGWKTHEKRAP